MSRLLPVRLTVAGLLLVLVLYSDRMAGAHDANPYFSTKWFQGEIDIYFDGTVPASTAFRSRVIEGQSNWSAANTGRPTVDFLITSTNLSATGCADDFNSINYFNIADPDTLAETRVCFFDDDNYATVDPIDTIEMIFDYDSGNPLYTGSTVPVPSGQYDLASIATHEWGHGYGGWLITHFQTATDLCNNPSTKHTMCPTIAPGTSGARTTAEHDVHTMANVYLAK